MKGDRFVAAHLCLNLQVSSAWFHSPGGVGGKQEQFECYLKCKQILKKHMLSPSLVTGIDFAAVHFAYLCSQAITSLPRHRIYYGG